MSVASGFRLPEWAPTPPALPSVAAPPRTPWGDAERARARAHADAGDRHTRTRTHEAAQSPRRGTGPRPRPGSRDEVTVGNAALPFRTGQAQFRPGLSQPVLHFSNSKTQKRARALDTGSHRQSALDT